MKINCFSVTFWFNIFNDHSDFLKVLSNELKDEYQNFNFFNDDNNLLAPVITAVNNDGMTNLSCSKINFQYNMNKVEFKDFPTFKEKVLKLFNLLKDNNIEILHSAIFINGETIDEEALKKIAKNTINSKLVDDDLIDINLRIGKKYEDLFYKIITVLNKKQIKLPQKVDSEGRLLPIPLISWHGAFVEHEIIEISYELNDKYSFDFTKNYQTTEFYLNKMLYILENNFNSDIENLLENGEI